MNVCQDQKQVNKFTGVSYVLYAKEDIYNVALYIHVFVNIYQFTNETYYLVRLYTLLSLNGDNGEMYNNVDKLRCINLFRVYIMVAVMKCNFFLEPSCHEIKYLVKH